MRRATTESLVEIAPMTPLPRPAWLPESVWPFETSSLEFEGSRIAVTDVGRGPVLLFVHTGFWSFIWRDVFLRLAPDFRCIGFDAPGTGQSGRLPADQISLESASRAMTAVVQRLHLEEITLVVHDLGGPSGVAGAARTPERFRGLCAINAFAWEPSGALFRSMLALMGSRAVTELDALTGILPRVTASAFGVGRNMDETSRRAFRSGIGTQGARSFHAYLQSARASDELYGDVESALAGVFRPLPVLTIFGERNDPLGFQPRWKALFPDAEQVVVSGGNHFPMCDDPDLVANAIREWHGERVALRSSSASLARAMSSRDP